MHSLPVEQALAALALAVLALALALLALALLALTLLAQEQAQGLAQAMLVRRHAVQRAEQ